MTPSQAARIIGCSTRKVGDLCRDGRIDARLVDGHWYLTDEAVEAFVMRSSRPSWDYYMERAATYCALNPLSKLMNFKPDTANE